MVPLGEAAHSHGRHSWTGWRSRHRINPCQRIVAHRVRSFEPGVDFLFEPLRVLAVALVATLALSLVYVVAMLILGTPVQFIGLAERIFGVMSIAWMSVFARGLLRSP